MIPLGLTRIVQLYTYYVCVMYVLYNICIDICIDLLCIYIPVLYLIVLILLLKTSFYLLLNRWKLMQPI